MLDAVIWSVLALGVINLAVLIWILLRRDVNAAQLAQQQEQVVRHQALLAQINSNSESLTRELRRDITESSRDARQELTQNLATFQQALVQQGAEATRTQNTQIDAFGQQLALLQKTLSFIELSELASRYSPFIEFDDAVLFSIVFEFER